MRSPLISLATIGVSLAPPTGACSSAGSSTGAGPATAAAPTTTAATVPGATWATTTPAAARLDPAVLDDVADHARSGGSNCLVVVRDGKLVASSYFNGRDAASTQDVFSATKSIASLLVGIAEDEGALDIDQPASTWITEWKGTPSANVTVRDILSGDSGREWSPTVDYQGLVTARDRTAYAIGLRQTSAPGTVWAYNNSADQTLERVLRAATGDDVATFAQQHLFDPLGMTHTSMTRDRAGNPQLFEGVHSNCEDMARLGVLVLNHGMWGTRRIVSSSWIDASTGHSSTKLNAAYGYLWWLNRPGVIGSPLVATNLKAAANPQTLHGPLVPGAPHDMVWALGLGDQMVQVDPGSHTVVARLGAAGRPTATTFGPAEASRVVTQAVEK